MPYDLTDIHSTVLKPPVVMVTGTSGVGKTTFASSAPEPVFIQAEDGAGNLPLRAFPLVASFDDVMDCIATLYSTEHEYHTLVIDSLDHVEPLIWEQVCRDAGVKQIEDLTYQKGYINALGYWRQLVDGCRALRDVKYMMIIWIAHAEIKRFESPEHDAIDRYEPKLHKRATALMCESCDVIGFARHKVMVRTEETGFGNKRNIGIATGQRELCLVETPAYIAKNRYQLPDHVELSWEAFSAALNASVQQQEVAANG